VSGCPIILGLLLVLSDVTRAAPDEPPPLPRDTLPDDLSLDSVPLGLDSHRWVPDDNPITDAKVRLGRRLFFDPILSEDRTVACASCHDPAHGFAGKLAISIGVRGRRGTRNAPSLLNVAYNRSMFWDGRLASLEDQVLQPIESPQEMGSGIPEALRRLQLDDGYRKQFSAAFTDGITDRNLARAIASFERTLLAGNSKLDAFKLSGKLSSLDTSERHGMWLFESKGRCWRCHSGRNFTDNDFHNTGVGWGKEPADLGRFMVTRKESDRGRFKTPSLRGVAHTAPYMHDGSIATLEEVVEFYNRGGGKNPQLDTHLIPLGLSNEEVRSLVAFLRALSTGGG
jgi:cytochrome c peroxidase